MRVACAVGAHGAAPQDWHTGDSYGKLTFLSLKLTFLSSKRTLRRTDDEFWEIIAVVSGSWGRVRPGRFQHHPDGHPDAGGGE